MEDCSPVRWGFTGKPRVCVAACSCFTALRGAARDYWLCAISLGLALYLSSSFSTDDDNDTEVEAIEVDTELNLVTECWVEPQSGHVHSTAENWRHLHGLPYQKIPKAVRP